MPELLLLELGVVEGDQLEVKVALLVTLWEAVSLLDSVAELVQLGDELLLSEGDSEAEGLLLSVAE